MKRAPWFLALVAIPVTAHAHVGSPDVYFEGAAGPYRVLVTVRPPTAVPGIAEVLHARFVEHRYPPHTHDTWAVIIIDGGENRYDLARHHRGHLRVRRDPRPPGVGRRRGQQLVGQLAPDL